jgi:hypothetical protein
MTLSIGFIIVLIRLWSMVYKYGLFNVHTQNIIKEIHKTFMENQCLWFIKMKMVIHLAQLMTKYSQRFDIKIYIFVHFTPY